MTLLLRSLTLATIPLAVLGGGIFLSVNGRGPGSDIFSEWWQILQHGQRLQADVAYLWQSREAMDAVVADLIAGRLSLRQAADALSAESESRPTRYRIFLGDFPGRSEEERSLYWALHRAEAVLPDDSRRTEILRRLRAELQACLDDQPEPLAQDR